MEMKNRNTRQSRSRSKLPIIIAAVVVLLLLLVLGALLLFGNGQQPEPTEPSESIGTSQPTESLPPAVEVPVKVWDMEALPKDLVAAGMAYASSNENIPGNLLIGGGAERGFWGSQAFKYHFVGDFSVGDIYIMSPFALNDPTLVTDWSQGEMLWFWVNGTELLQTVRLEVTINGQYPVTGATYYTIDEKGMIQPAGEIPAASNSSGSRGRVHIKAGQEGWIGLPLSMYDNPKVLSSIQIIVGNTTIKAGNTLYLDEFWITKMDQTPDMPMAELLYKTTDSLTHGGIWDVEDVEVGTVAGDMYDTEGRLDATGTVYAGKGVLGSQAWGYKMLEVNGAHTQNLSMVTAKMAQFGYRPRAIKSGTDILWFWIDSDLSADQRLHLQLNDVSTACWKSIYTIRNNGGTPQLQEIPFASNEGQVVGVGLVPHDGKNAGLYSRLKISAGWSGWVGIPVENFCVSPSGESLPVPSGRVNRLLMRLNGAVNSMQVGDTLYFDELWVTGAGEMPQLSKEALLYGYTPAYVKEPITYGKLWGVDHTNLLEGMQIGQIHNREDRNEVTTNIVPGRGVGGGKAWAYTVLNSIANNSANVDLFPAELDKVGFQLAKITAQTDILWFWLDSNAATDQILHLQLNDGMTFMSQEKKIYTIEAVDGVASMKEVGFHADAAALTEGIGLIPISGYARIKVCAGWSGWIGVPVENFCVTGTGEASAVKHETVNTIIVRGYVTSKDLLQEEDSFFFDEFWLTPADKMPELTNEQLLYKAPADPVLEFDGMFTSSMILQQNKPWIVRGKGEAGMTVTVKLVDKDGNAVQTRQTYVEKDGLWTVTMEAVSGGYDAYRLVITSGTAKKSVKDLVFGEVWVAGGQSNMAYNIETTNPGQAMLTPEAREALKLRLESNANASYIRCFMQALGYLGDEARTEPSGKWFNGAVWSQVEDCSATAFLFAEALQAKLDVPVGVVVPARGGKSLSSFVDKETAAEYEAFYQMLRDKGFLSPDSGDANYLSGWYNSLVSGWKGYEVSGMIWYQGEQDINQREIQELGIEVLVASWSKVFNSEETVDALPFVGIQLAPYDSEGADSRLSANYYLNESIRKGIDKVVAAGGKAVAVPIYDLPIEINNIHPDNKPMVGIRVAEVAYGMVYGREDAVISGPVLKDVDYSVSGKVILTFDKIAQGLKYIRLTEQDNLRILPEGHSYDVSDFYADKLNGFTVWTGRKLIPADAVIDPADPSKVIITPPEGEQVLGIYYGFGIEVLSANLYNSENLPALPFRHVREGADQVDLRTPLWDLDESDEALKDKFVATGGSRNDPIFERVPEMGISGSNALAYGQSTTGKGTTFESGLKTAAVLKSNGVNADVMISDVDDVIWFWMDSDMANDMRLQVFINGDQLIGGIFDGADENEDIYIYTITKDADAKPQVEKVIHRKYDAVIDGIGLVNPRADGSGTYSQIKLANGWHGWVGIPVNMLRNGSVRPGDSLESVTFYMSMVDGIDGSLSSQREGDCIYIDEMWITGAGQIPGLSEEELFYNGDIVNEKLWDLDESDAELTGFTDAGGNRNKPTLQRVSGKGVLGTNALKYSLTTVGKNTGSEIGWNDATGAALQAEGFRTDLQIQADDDVLWFWMDSDMSTAFRMAFMVNGQTVRGGSADCYIYYIVEENGEPVMKKAMHSNFDTVSEPVALVNYSAANTHRNSRIRISDGWSGWIGIPANMFDRGVLSTTNNKINQLRIFMNWDDALDGGLANQVIGDSIYFDNFYITSNGEMPDVSKEALLYDGDYRAPLWDLEDQKNDATVGNVTADNNAHDVTASVSKGNGLLGSNALAYELAGVVANKTGSEVVTVNLADYGFRTTAGYGDQQVMWFWADSDLSADVRLILSLDVFRTKGYDNGNTDATYHIYTIQANADGDPSVVKVSYQHDDTNDADGVDGLSYVHYTSAAGNVNPLARIKISAGWSGWIGIPLSNYWENKSGIKTLAQYCGDLDTMTLQLYRNNALDGGVWKADESLYLDEFWFTDEGLMPELSKDALLYHGDTYTAGSDDSYRHLWDLDESDAELTGFTDAGGNRNKPTLQRVSGKGVLGTNALKYSLTTVGKNTGSEIGWNDATGAALQAEGFRTDLQIQADDDVLWFWMDSDMSTAFRMAFMVNGQTVRGGSADCYIYYIVEENGEPVMKKAMHSNFDTVSEPVALVNYSAANTHRNSRIRISDGWSGWIGIPANMFDRGVLSTTNNKINQLRIFMNWDDALDGGLANQVIGDSIYFDNFCITSANKMPPFAKQILLYSGD